MDTAQPFGSSPIWPPVDADARPRPVLVAGLIVVSSVVYKVFYARTKHQDVLNARKRDQCIAQMASVLSSRESAFVLGTDEAQVLLDANPAEPKVFEEPDDLVVKQELRVLAGATTKTEKSLKGRKLTSVGGKAVSTTVELAVLVAELPVAAWPITFVFEATPPTAQRLYELVVCDVHDQVMTQQGIPDDDRFRAIKALFQERLSAELAEGGRKTLFSRGLGDIAPDEAVGSAAFASGQKLRDLVKLAEEAQKHGVGVPRAAVLAAEDVLRRVGLSQRGRLRPLAALLAPALPYWFCGCLLHGSLECVVAKLCTGQTIIMDLVSTKAVDVPLARFLTLQWITGWVIIHIFGWFFAHLFQQRAVATFGTRVKAAAMQALVRQDFEYFDKNPAGELQQRLDQDAAKLEHSLLRLTRELCTEVVAIVANLYLVYTMAPRDMFLAALAPLPFIAFGQWFLLRCNRRFHRRVRRLSEHAAASTAQVLTEIKTVREFAMEHDEGIRYGETCELQAGLDEHRSCRAGFCGHFMHILHLSGEALTLCLGAEKVANGELRAGELVAIMMMVSCMIGGKLRGVFERLAELAFVVEPAGRIADLLESDPKIEPRWPHFEVRVAGEQARQLQRAVSPTGHLLRDWVGNGVRVPAGRQLVGAVVDGRLVDRPVLAQLREPLDLRFSRGLRPAAIAGRIEFRDVEFRYPVDPRKCVLRHVTFTVEAGQHVALVGHAGCGKSTIFKLVQRLYEPTRGCVKLDGFDLGEYDVHYLRRKVSVVAQENVLFQGTILDNVAYGVVPHPSETQVRAALRRASALEFVDAFPDSLHTRVGARGTALSGGQRQRVAIARAMVRDPSMLILDEATSALDPTNEKIVQAALEELVRCTGVTAMTIAHRLTTVKDCDKLFVFAEGRLVEEGTHASLLDVPVERAQSKDGKDGAVIRGFYASQWASMMGKPKEMDGKTEDSASATSTSSAELLRLETELTRSRAELAAARCAAGRADDRLAAKLGAHTPVPSDGSLVSSMPPLLRASSAPCKPLCMLRLPLRT